MKITVLGATGQTGLEVVRQALAAGRTLSIYVRRHDGLPSNPRLEVVIGQLDDVAALTKDVLCQPPARLRIIGWRKGGRG